MKIKEFSLVMAYYYVDIESKINLMIKDGWQPYGRLIDNKVSTNKTDDPKLYIAMVKYEEDTKKTERKLIDFSVNWYPTVESMNRNEKELLIEGWETFKKESVDYSSDIMTHKLMMVKYED